MTLLAPIALGTVATVAAILAGLTALAYVLKMRRRRFEVPFSTLWQRVLREREASSLWKHLRRLLSLLLALVILGLLLFAVTEPRLGHADPDARSVVIIIDTSASMKTRDEAGKRSRIEVAREKARELLDAMGGGDHAMLLRMDGQTTPLSRFGGDVAALRRLLRDLEPSDTPADLRRALEAAADALHGRPNPMIVLIGDGAYDEETLGAAVWQPPGEGRLDAIDLSGIDVRYVPVGKTAENVGIIAFNVRRYVANKLSYEVFIEVENFGDEVARRKLVLYGGDDAVDVRHLELAPGERLRQIYPDLSGGEDHRLRAELEREDPGQVGGDVEVRDAFALDDVAWALLPERKRQDVLLVTRDNLYLEGAMLVYDNIRVDKLTPDEYERQAASGELPPYTAVVFDDVTPTTLPPEPTHLMYFHPTGPAAPFPVARTLRAPRITEVDPDHPVTRWLVMSDVNFDAVDVYRVERSRGEVALAVSVRDPILAARRDGRRKIVAAGFSLTGTDLMMRVAFPLLLVNTLDWFAGDDADLITTYRTGTRVQVPMDATAAIAEAEVASPSGKTSRAPLVEGNATFYAGEVGVHRVTARGGADEGGDVTAELDLAANLASPSESDIEPSAELVLGGRPLEAPAGFTVTRRQALWSYLAIAALLLLSVEWLTYHRRVTV